MSAEEQDETLSVEERLSRVVGYFNKHLVVLVARSEHWAGPYVATTFVISVADQWFLATAGHVLEDLQSEIARVPDGAVQFMLVDSGGLDAKDFTPVPFVLDANLPLVLGDDSDFDYAAIPLSPFYRRQLEANGIAALDEQVWEKQPTSADYFVLLGVPRELVTPQPDGTLDLGYSMHVLQYRPDPPDGFKEKKGPRFHFDIAMGAGVDIKGMSGGPVFALRREPNDQLRYWLIGVQSSWLPVSKVVATCPAPILGETLSLMIRTPDEVVELVLAQRRQIDALREEIRTLREHLDQLGDPSGSAEPTE